MATFLIPTSTTESSYTQRTALDGVTYTLRFQWNARERAWYLHLSTADDEPIVGGLKVVVGFPLLRGLTDARRPPGELIAVARDGDDSPPGLYELGDRVRLTYIDEAGVAALRPAPAPAASSSGNDDVLDEA